MLRNADNLLVLNILRSVFYASVDTSVEKVAGGKLLSFIINIGA